MHAVSFPERVIVAPSVGVFRSLFGDHNTEGQYLNVGQSIGVIESQGHSTQVRTPFRGNLVGMLASDGERIREGEPIAWLRITTS